MKTQTAHRNTLQQMQQYGHILMLSAWGFVIAIASLLFLYVGYLLDEWLGTAPNFMLGLFFLAIVTTIIRLYQEAWVKRNKA
jgi:F0F1-type ATP synthase assembly protein I